MGEALFQERSVENFSQLDKRQESSDSSNKVNLGRINKTINPL